MMSSCAPIVFYDSGVGGLPYLEQARLSLPGENFVYYADRAGFPYGEKEKAEVIRLALVSAGAIVRKLQPKVLVIACNTATELAIQEIRLAFPGLPVVGTVPAIKPAARLSRIRRVAIVATERAVHDPYLLELAGRWAPDCHVERIGDGRLVNFVETQLIGSTAAERLAAVRPAVTRALAAGADVIVLGCTHFIHLAGEFSQVAGPEVKIIDSRTGVVDQLIRILGERSCTHEGSDSKEGYAMMYLSGSEPFGSRYESFASRYRLVPAGSLLP
ncbi:MAG: glutamate racemase [Clostridia bacterium]|jgi:glutamate racemase|nr:glutamate racemase [Spirochaetia bacterium]